MAPKPARKHTHEESEGHLHGVDILAAAATALKSDGTGPSAGRTAGGKKGISANWGGSSVDEEQLERLIDAGYISPLVQARAPGDEIEPAPAAGEIVVFVDHLYRGFSPPGNLFFRQVLDYYKLRIHDLAPNSILTLSNFVTLCEDYLQVQPDINFLAGLLLLQPTT